MESKDPISKRYVYEPGLEDGMTNDYLAELEKLGYRKDEDVSLPKEIAEKDPPEFQTESKPTGEEKELDIPGGWVLLHGDTANGDGRCIVRESNILEVSSATYNMNKAFVLIKRSESEEAMWISVKESFEEVVEKIANAWRENYVNS